MSVPAEVGGPVGRGCLGMIAVVVASALGALGLLSGTLVSALVLEPLLLPSDVQEVALIGAGFVGAAAGTALGATMVALVIEDVWPGRSFWRVTLVPVIGIVAAVGAGSSPVQSVAPPVLAAVVSGLGAAALAGMALIRAEEPDEDALRRRGRAP